MESRIIEVIKSHGVMMTRNLPSVYMKTFFIHCKRLLDDFLCNILFVSYVLFIFPHLVA